MLLILFQQNQDDLIAMHPLAILFFGFLLIPLIEIFLLIEVGGVIGAFPTIFLVVFTAVLGAYLLRIQGFVTIARIRETMARGGIPAMEMVEGAVLLVSGALLLTPGFFTDAIGFACLVPGLRRFFILRLLQRFIQPFGTGPRTAQPGQAGHHQPREPDVIEGEFRRDDNK